MLGTEFKMPLRMPESHVGVLSPGVTQLPDKVHPRRQMLDVSESPPSLQGDSIEFQASGFRLAQPWLPQQHVIHLSLPLSGFGSESVWSLSLCSLSLCFLPFK